MTLATFKEATVDADLGSINNLATLKVPLVTGTSIFDELTADGWAQVTPFTLAIWRPIMLDRAFNRIIMGFDGGGVLRGFGWWHLDGDEWDVKLIAIDKRLTAQQRSDGLHDLFQWQGGRYPPETKYRGIAREGSRIDTFLGTRLPPERRAVLLDRLAQPTGFVLFRTTAAEAVALL